ncbi:hypothetical protein F53441_8626 [Fusarium austroafricanum]|uniref:Retrovirus-related Pol polyprotein from transposon TNT 1-94-like beta-barrel domain-containing protein n=1 Tax=Fusarium austroafricanum TaxID=2364996 RepID=A0A8H4KD88_9HYPO|nr:hypothetical protein F53441_8626 [Fusarium austroafricanum]
MSFNPINRTRAGPTTAGEPSHSQQTSESQAQSAAGGLTIAEPSNPRQTHEHQASEPQAHEPPDYKPWVLSMASNVHICTYKGWYMADYVEYNSRVASVATGILEVDGIGTVILPMERTGNDLEFEDRSHLILRNVLHCPTAPTNIVGQGIEPEYRILSLYDEDNGISGDIRLGFQNLLVGRFKGKGKNNPRIDTSLPPLGPLLASPWDLSGDYFDFFELELDKQVKRAEIQLDLDLHRPILCPTWICHPANNVHICCNRDWFGSSYCPINTHVESSDGLPIQVVGIGTVILFLKQPGGKTRRLMLEEVLHAPRIPFNMFKWPYTKELGRTRKSKPTQDYVEILNHKDDVVYTLPHPVSNGILPPLPVCNGTFRHYPVLDGIISTNERWNLSLQALKPWYTFLRGNILSEARVKRISTDPAAPQTQAGFDKVRALELVGSGIAAVRLMKQASSES